MALNVIGAGVGRTGTYSLKLAVEQLGLGPCYHMEEVLKNPPLRVPHWLAAADGKPDWHDIFDGFNSAVDWPTAGFWKELAVEYPKAKVVLTVRTPESWYESFSETINTLMKGAEHAPPEMQPFMKMSAAVLGRTGFRASMSREEFVAAFSEHTRRVTEGVPADRLLVYQVKEGWEPLCRFLGRPVPSEPFPVTNNREDFWARFK